MKQTKLRLRPWVKKALLIIGITAVLFVILAINNYLSNEMEEHIERVSKECATQGYGIKAKYTKEGDKYYVCNK